VTSSGALPSTRAGLFSLIRALTWPSDPDAAVTLEVTVAARREDRCDKATLRKRLLEPMEEAGSKCEAHIE